MSKTTPPRNPTQPYANPGAQLTAEQLAADEAAAAAEKLAADEAAAALAAQAADEAAAALAAQAASEDESANHVTMHKDGMEIPVHNTTVVQHERLGWKVKGRQY